MSRQRVCARVNSPIDGVTVHFEADDDDRLWEKFGDYFRGQWEDRYADIHSFLEDNGLVLNPEGT